MSDRWFASGPVQTFPNRVFAHCATPGVGPSGSAYLNDTDYKDVIEDGGVTCPSVFSVLDGALPGQTNWKIYYVDAANVFFVPAGILSVLLVSYVRNVYVSGANQTQVAQYGQFANDVAHDTLPRYSFIEPRYFNASDGRAQSNHPGNAVEPLTSGNPEAISVCEGEAFLADIYNTLCSNQAVFDKTLLVVIYDEHGGVYDHVPPPSAPSPWPTGTVMGFDYSRYGVRIPCLLINPYVNRADGVAFRPQVPGNPNPFDHTTIIQTVIQQFLASSQWTNLTNRDANAPVLSGLINPGNTPIPNVSLPPLSCPAPPVYSGGSGEIPGSSGTDRRSLANRRKPLAAPNMY